eukprot:6214031-Pleurochrysis_carterae.AAC.5
MVFLTTFGLTRGNARVEAWQIVPCIDVRQPGSSAFSAQPSSSPGCAAVSRASASPRTPGPTLVELAHMTSAAPSRERSMIRSNENDCRLYPLTNT